MTDEQRTFDGPAQSVQAGHGRRPQGIRGALNSEAFDVYIEQVLAPELEPETVVIADNLQVPKSVRAMAALKARNCWLLFIPPYSPEYNPIEMAFSKLKAHLRRIGARTFDELINAIGSVCDLFTHDECWNYFAECGYTWLQS